MSWNKPHNSTNKLICEKQSTKAPLLFSKLQQEYLQFVNSYDTIVEYNEHLSKLSYSEYKKQYKIIHEYINSFPSEIQSIFKLILEIKQSEEIEETYNHQIQMISTQVTSKKNNLNDVIESIVMQERTLNKRQSLLSIKSSQSEEQGSISSKRTSDFTANDKK
jgi:hypothetical protein